MVEVFVKLSDQTIPSTYGGEFQVKVIGLKPIECHKDSIDYIFSKGFFTVHVLFRGVRVLSLNWTPVKGHAANTNLCIERLDTHFFNLDYGDEDFQNYKCLSASDLFNIVTSAMRHASRALNKVQVSIESGTFSWPE